MTPDESKKFWLLHRQLVKVLTLQGMSPKTIDSYTRSLRRLADYFDRCPVDITVDELKQYFADLVNSHSWSTVKVDRNAFQHFWKHILEKEWDWVKIVKPPQNKSLPDILSIEEVQKLLNAFNTLHYRVYFLTVYSMGLRRSEAVKLRVGDIDSHFMQVHIRAAKYNKDRFTPLPTITLRALRTYWSTHRNPVLIFPSRTGEDVDYLKATKRTMNVEGCRNAMRAALKDCNINKPVTIHSLRHSFGTHLVQMGVHLRHIQEHLGHSTPKTTELYTHLTEISFQNQRDMINELMSNYTIDLG